MSWLDRSGQKNVTSSLVSGTNALCIAAMCGYKDIVELFVSYGVDVRAGDKRRMTSLHWAAFGGNRDIVKLLLSKGANINAQDIFGNNALFWAAINGYTQVVTLLLSKGSEIPKIGLHAAADGGHSDLINLFLLEGMDINLKDEESMKALHYAAKNDRKESVALLLAKGADIEAKNYHSETPLILAVKNGHKRVIDLLLTEGAYIETTTNKSQTPLIVSAKYGQNEVTSLLLSKGANSKAKDDEDRTAFHWAVCNPRTEIEIMELFLSQSLELIKARTAKQETVLILAVQYGAIEMIKFLLMKNVDIEANDCNGMNAWQWATVKKRLKVVELLS